MLRVKSRSWVAIFSALVFLVVVIIAFMVVFSLTNGIPFIKNEKTFSTSIPFYFYATGENPTSPNYAIWVTFTTRNTIGDVFIAGDRINVSATMIDNNNTFPLQYTVPTFILGFQDALAWRQNVTLKTPLYNFGEYAPASIQFHNVTGSNIWITPLYSIYYPLEGSFAPILYVNNETEVAGQAFTENSTFIPIESVSATINQSYNQVNEALTYALVFFGIVELRTPIKGSFDRAFSNLKEEPRKEATDNHHETKNENPDLIVHIKDKQQRRNVEDAKVGAKDANPKRNTTP